MDIEQNPIETGLYRIKIVTLMGVLRFRPRGMGVGTEVLYSSAIFDIFISYFGYGEIYTWFGILLILKDVR